MLGPAGLPPARKMIRFPLRELHLTQDGLGLHTTSGRA